MSAGFLLDTNALAAGLTLATRNTKDFEHIDGLRLAGPWQAPVPH